MYLIDAGMKHDRGDISLLNEFRLYLADLDFKNRKAFVNQEQTRITIYTLYTTI